jgi:N-acetylglucosaminyldiphosphoundecaprenol N-acetyl-beta-D-mannosaminyltransferase
MLLSTPSQNSAAPSGEKVGSAIGSEAEQTNMSVLPEVKILGVRLHDVTTKETLQRVDGFVNEGGAHQVCTTNVDFIIQAQTDREFFRILNQAHLSVPDGMGVIYASRFLGTPLKENVKGRILVIHICRMASERGYSVFLLGGEPGVAATAAELLRHQFPELKVAGTLSPTFGFENNPHENEAVIGELRRAAPDILFVGLGAPKQDKWIADNLNKTNVKVALGIGGTFDIISGRIKEAPRWMTDIGLEWLFRLTREPGRLWKRYLVRDPKFLWKVVEQKIGKDFSARFEA